MATDSSSDRNPVERLAEEFLDRRRRGERASLDEYADRYPEWAEQIREVFPALEMIERLKPASGDRTGSFDGEETHLDEGAPERLGDYRIIREVGRGGMGVVYEAVQESLGRHVALKVLPMQGRIDTVQMERFRLEARSAAKLHHTHIVPVHGVGQHGGVHYYAMQFIQGCGMDSVLDDLRRLRSGAAAVPDPGSVVKTREEALSRAVAQSLLAGGSTEPMVGERNKPAASSSDGSRLSGRIEPGYHRSVARIGVQVADALAHAHGQGVLHRDIKPSNLLLDADGEAWVTDFGLAKLEGSDGPTRTGDVVGTLRYMAPERFEGWSDPRSDVYGLGITLYELLTLKPAHDGPTRARLIERVLDAAPPAPRKIDPRIPRDLETIVLKAIAKEPGARYATAKALSEDLGNYLSGKPIRARRVGPVERTWRWCRRNPAAAALMGVSGIAILTLVGLGVALGYHSRLHAAYAEKDAALARELTFLYLNRILFAERELNDNHPHRAEELLDACPPALRDWEWNYLKRQCHTELLTIACGQGFVRSVCISPDGKLIATTGALDGTVKLWHADTGKHFKTLSGHHVESEACCAFSPDGTRIASVGSMGTHSDRSNHLLVHLVATGEEVWRVPVHTGTAAGVTFSPEGRTIVVASGAMYPSKGASKYVGWVRAFDAESGEPRHEFPTDAARGAKNPSFSSDGKRLMASLGNDNSDRSVRDPLELRVWDFPPKGMQLRIRNENLRGLVSAGFSPDGETITTCGYDSTLRLWDATDGRERAVFRGHQACTNFVAFSPDGQRVATTSDDGSARIWDLRTRETLITLRGHRGSFHAVTFSPDGRRLITSSNDGTVRVWDATAGPEARTITASSRDVRALAFSQDGRRLLTGDFEGLLKVWDVPSGRLLDTWRGHTAPIWDVALSPDGSLVASAAGDWQAEGDIQGEVHIRDTATGRLVRALPAHQAIARLVKFSPDGRRLVSAGGETRTPGQAIIIWDVTTWTAERTILNSEGGPVGLALSPDGRSITASLLSGIHTWDAETGKLSFSLTRTALVCQCLEYSRDGGTLFSVYVDGSVGVWDVPTRKLLKVLLADNFETMNVAFNPAGTRMVSVGSDLDVKIWDPAKSNKLLIMRGHARGSRSIYGLAFSRDGHWIATSDEEGVVKLWDGTPWDEPPSPILSGVRAKESR